MSAALLTAAVLSLVGLLVSFALGFLADSQELVLQHATLAIFVTLIMLLAYSMSCVYLSGTVRAIKDAGEDAALETDAVARASAVRPPVFKLGSVAMAVTMVTAVIGGGVDTNVIPAGFHLMLGVLAILANGVALRAVVAAFNESNRIVDEVNRLLGVE